MTASYAKGLIETGPGIFAWLQPDGGWGWSNAGLIVDGDQSLLVDTLFDLKLTGEMLTAMQSATGIAADAIGAVVNTHANGDHTHGNGLCRHAEIIASDAAAREMEHFGAPQMAAFKSAGASGALGVSGRYFAEIFAPFEFAGIAERAPTRTFSGQLDLQVGDKAVELIEVGPAHTAGDVLVHVPEARTVFTGDILFIEGTPIMWAGPVGNWLAACDRILAMPVDTIVPGHGPVTDKAGVREVAAYLTYIRDEARARYDAGMDAVAAARDIGLGRFATWRDAERIVVNVDTLYREFAGDTAPPDALKLFEHMGQLYYDRR